MAGPVEEAGKVAGGLIDALKAQPAVLALTVANIGMMVFIFYALHAAATFRDNMIKLIFEESKQVNQLLQQCVPVGKTTGPTLPLQPMGEKPEPVEDPPKPPPVPDDPPKPKSFGEGGK